MALLMVALGIALFGLAACGSTTKSPSRGRARGDRCRTEGTGQFEGDRIREGPASLATFAFDPQGRLWLTAAGLETHTRDGVY